MALLEVDTLSVDYGDPPALSALTFNVGKGQAFGVAGAAGAGKTTLALALGGLLPPTAKLTGAIRFDGSTLPAREEAVARLRGQRIALLFGDGRTALDPLRTLRDQIGDPETLKDTGLDGALHPHELTATQNRRALLALALAQQPDVLVADEPTHSLHAVGAREILDLLATLQKRLGFALLLLSRDYRAIAHCCTDATILRGGRAVDIGSAASLFARPQHDYTRALVAAGKLRPRPLGRAPIGDFLTLRDVSFAIPSGGAAKLNFAIRRGEALAVVAAPNSGKTRLARIVAGVERARSGLLVLDHDSYHGDDIPLGRRREISMVFAHPRSSFDPRLPVGTSLSQPLRLEPHRTMEEQADRMMGTVYSVGLEDAQLLRALPATLTPEQLYRLAVARALIARPKLMIVDDPAGGFDPERRNALVELLNRVRSDYGLTLLVLTRDLDIARALADRDLVMDNGSIVEEAHPADLIASPKHALTQALAAARLPDVAVSSAPPAIG